MQTEAITNIGVYSQVLHISLQNPFCLLVLPIILRNYYKHKTLGFGDLGLDSM